jgi:hypothetical protein
MAAKAESVPAAPSGSRFALTKTLAGWSVPGGVAGAILHAYGSLLDARRKDAAAFDPPSVEFKLKYVVKRGNGWEVVDRGSSIVAQSNYLSQRPSRVWKGIKDGSALLDSFFLGETKGAWGLAPDAEVWNALLDFCQRYEPDGRTRRKLCDFVAIALALRAGIEIAEADLPHPPS